MVKRSRTVVSFLGLLLILALGMLGCSQLFWTGNYWIIRIIDVETSSAVELLRSYSGLFSPRWSPAENIIAYYSSENEGGLYRIDSDGTNKTLIISIEAIKVPNYNSIDIAWSPDGNKLLYLIPAAKEFKIISKEGTEEISIAISTMETVSYPVWSSDNQKIAFISGGRIYTINVDGTNLSQVTSDDLEVGSLDWDSAEGEMIFEARKTGSGTWEVYKINPDGTGREKLVTGRKPKWSPDGQKIAFVSEKATWLMNANGQDIEKLSEKWAYAYYWSPDGTKIITSNGMDVVDYVINVSSKSYKEMLYIGGAASWSPDSKKVVTNDYIPD